MSASKKDFASNVLKNGGQMFVHLDATHSAVAVPSWLKDKSELVLQFGDDVPTNDLNVSDIGITATLYFNKSPHKCFIHWASIFAITDDKRNGRLYVEAMPSSLRSELKLDEVIQTKNNEALTFVRDGEDARVIRQPKQKQVLKRTKRQLPPYLKVVK